MNRLFLIILLILIAISTLLFALSQGSTAAGLGEIRAALDGSGDPMLRDVVLQLRWPRAAAAFGTGASLALAGAMMQVLEDKGLLDKLVAIKPKPAAQKWLTTVHTREYVRRVETSCERDIGYVDSRDAPASKESYQVSIRSR